MGEANRRGTYEQRKAMAIEKQKQEIKAIRKRARQGKPLSLQAVAILTMAGIAAYDMKPLKESP